MEESVFMGGDRRVAAGDARSSVTGVDGSLRMVVL